MNTSPIILTIMLFQKLPCNFLKKKKSSPAEHIFCFSTLILWWLRKSFKCILATCTSFLCYGMKIRAAPKWSWETNKNYWSSLLLGCMSARLEINKSSTHLKATISNSMFLLRKLHGYVKSLGRESISRKFLNLFIGWDATTGDGILQLSCLPMLCPYFFPLD